MLENIAIGTNVQVTVVKTPQTTAATKTLVRVLLKDPEHQTEKKRLTYIRHRLFNPQRRGGRLYGGQRPKIVRLKGERGETGTVLATMDVLRDLASVKRFVEVKPA